MKRKKRIILATLSAFIFTLLMSALGYYVFAQDGESDLNKPVFSLSASAEGKYSVGSDIRIRCKLDISTFYTNGKYIDFKDMKFVLNNNKAVSDKSGNLDNLPAGTIIYSESVSAIPNYRQEITDGKFNKDTHEFDLYFKVKTLPKDKDGNELNVIIDDNLLKGSYIICGGEEIPFDNLNQTNCINVDVVSEQKRDIMPVISAKCTNVVPKESILDEKVDVTYQITANNFKYPNVTVGGTDTIVLLDNSNNNNQSESIVRNELWNKLSNGQDLRVGKDKFGLVSFSDKVIGYKTVPKNLRPEDKVSGKQDSEVAIGKAAYLTDYYNEYNDRTLKSNGEFTEEQYRGVFFNGGNDRKIVEGFTKVKEIFDDKDREDKAKGLDVTAKNVIIIVSGDIHYSEAEAEAIRNYNYNVYTIQITPKVTDPDDKSVEDFHKAIGGTYKDFHRNYEFINESHNALMQIVATSISQSMPKSYEFNEFTLVFNLGKSFGKTSGKPTEDKIIKMKMDNLKLVTKREGDEYKPYWYIKNESGGYDPVRSDESLQIHFDVYPKEVGNHLTFEEGGSYVEYNDVEGKPVTNLINQPDITVKDPAEPRSHGLDNGLYLNQINTIQTQVDIAQGTNATILTYANIFSRDVKLELKIDPRLQVIGNAHLYIFSGGQYNEKDSVSFGGSSVNRYMYFGYDDDSEVNPDTNEKLFKKITVNRMPDDWQRGDIVVLKYMVKVPESEKSVIGTSYNNDAIYSRVVPGLEDKTFKEHVKFTVISAEPPNLF